MKTVSKKLLSLLLVAFLLVSAIPFQAFADAHVDTHNSGWCYIDHSGHYIACTDPACDRYGQWIETAVHDFSAKNGICPVCGYQHVTHTYVNGVCSICGFACPSHNLVEVPGTYIAPTCTTDGKNADKTCAVCGMTETGAAISAFGHYFDGVTCNRCGITATSITLNPYPGTINNGASSTSYALVNNQFLINLPAPDPRNDFTFVGWQTANGQTIYPNSTANVTYDAAMGTTFTALWAAKTKHVEVYAVLNGNYASPMSGFVWQGEAPENGNLLDYLKNNAVSAVNLAVSNIPGLSWDGIFRDRLGNALADGTANQAQNIYVNFASIPYTLYFDADGGTVTPTSKQVYRGVPVGTLPTPYKEGMVFMGWQDTATGTVYTESTVYPNASDTMVKAVWKEQAKVYLRVYLNGNFATPDRLLEVDSFVVNDHISWSTVDAYLRKYYTPAAGSTMVVNGLFDKTTWAGYRANPNQERKSDIRVAANSGTEIYVMINGANAGTTVLPTNPTTPTTPTVPANGFWVKDASGNLVWYPAGSSLPNGNGYWVYDANGNPNIWVITGSNTVPTYIYTGSNPKTGDTAQIEIAAAVMVLAAAALITVMALRKKKSV